jgi:23S rRNA (guanosine2251-2'-O)-methyltransferase
VGSLLRTCEGIGVAHVYLTGYTPYPVTSHDERLPHIANKLTTQIHKTALDAENLIPWTHLQDPLTCIEELQAEGYTIVALEQTKTSVLLPQYTPPDKVALLLGREVEGIDEALLSHCDATVEIPMAGKKESFNVVQAAAMTLYHLRFN